MTKTEQAPPEEEKGCNPLMEYKVFKHITMTGGDWGSLTQLFFDNLSTVLGAMYVIQALGDENIYGPAAVSQELMNEIVWGKVVPAIGLQMFIGNVFYTWQGCHACEQYGRQYTANPYGINTPATFAVIYNVFYTAFFNEGLGDVGFQKAYNISLAANFVVGLIVIFLGLVGTLILKVVPPAGLLVPIAGIGIAFLGLENVAKAMEAPIIGFSTIMWVYLGWYANVRLGYGDYRLPEALQVILIGIIMGWAIGLNTPEATISASAQVKWWGPTWSADDLFADFGDVVSYLGTIIPLGISAAATSLMCLVSAKEAGDPYAVRTSMIFDGIGNCLAACFGSPCGLSLYIGHPAHKRNGATIGYSLINGIIYLIFSWFGILALIQSIVNPSTIGPIVFFVGLQVNEEALNFMPNRQYAAYILGIMPSIFDWVTNITNRSPMQSEDGMYNTNSPMVENFIGLLAWKYGALLVSLLWTSMIVMVLDRKWLGAAVWAVVASIFSVFGIIHNYTAGFDYFTQPSWIQCTSDTYCWMFGIQWMYFTGYLMLFVTFIGIHFLAKYDDTIEDAIEDDTAHAFDDWFADAYKYIDDDGMIRDSRYPDDDPEYAGDDYMSKRSGASKSERMADEMSGALKTIYGENENKDADAHYGNDHIGDEAAKTMKNMYGTSERPISQSRIDKDTPVSSSTALSTASQRNKDITSSWRNATGSGRKQDEKLDESIRHPENMTSLKAATGQGRKGFEESWTE